jgi:hypothetical protein
MIWWKELLGLIIWVILIACFIGLGFLLHGAFFKRIPKITDDIFNYHRLPAFLPQDGFFLDTHTHTLYSDGKMTVEQNIKWHIANGFKAMVLTDHNTAKGNKEFVALQSKYPEIVLIPGFEWTAQNCHMIFMGIMDFPDPVPRVATVDNIKTAIAKAHELGAVVMISHITWTQWQPVCAIRGLVHPSRQELLDCGVDGFEINNEVRWYDPESVYFVENLRVKNHPKPIFLATATDIHNPFEHWVAGWTELFLTPEEKSHPNWDVVKKALLEARTKIWVSHDYDVPPEIRLNSEKTSKPRFSTLFYPFYMVVIGLKGIPPDWKQILMMILYAAISYIPFRILFGIILS